MKTSNIIKTFALVLFLLSSNLTFSQDCETNSNKSITLENTIDQPCVSFIARDNIVLKPGFSYSSDQPYLRIEFKWVYDESFINNMPSITLDGYTYEGTEYYSFEDFIASLESLKSNLELDYYTTSLNYSEGEYATLLIAKNKKYTYSGNYSSAFVIPTEVSFNAQISDQLVFPVDYLTSVPDLTTCTPDTLLPFGSLEGNLNVSPTGAAIYEIPIMVPKGLNGLEPKISVNYNSQSGNGLLGWGFNVSGISVITRAAKNLYSDNETKGISIDTDDRFVLDGNRLVSETGTYGGAESTYRTENETFQQIISHGTYGKNSPSWFEIYAKNGTKYKYGSQTGRITYSASSKLAIVSWYLDYVEDIFGNTIQYTYEQKGLALYLTKITYGTNKSGIGIESSVEFYYEKRSDPIPIFYQPLKGQVDQVLYKIVTKTGSQILRSYNFEYSKDVFSRLIKVTESNGAGEQLNPTYFKWGNYNQNVSSSNNITIQGDGYPENNRLWFCSDVNGDGLSDLLSIFHCVVNGYSTNLLSVYFNEPNSNYLTFKYNNGFGPFDIGSNVNYDDVKANIHYFIFGDINADGKKEIIKTFFMKTSISELYFTLVSFHGIDVIRQVVNSNEIPSYDVGDFNNDGVDEIIYVEKNSVGTVKISYLDPSGTIQWHSFDLNISYPQKIFLGDYNTDGLLDFAVLNQYGFDIILNKGTNKGSSNPVFVSAAHNNSLNSTYDIIQQGDFNGDGLIDFVYNEHESPNWYLAINNGNFGFDKKYLYNVTAQNENFTDKDDGTHNCIVTDFNNDGKSDIIVFDADYEYHRSWDPKNGTIIWGTFKQFNTFWYKSIGESVSQIATKTSYNEQDAHSRLYVLGDFNGDRLPDLMNYGFDCYSGSDMTQNWKMYSTSHPNCEGGMVTSISNGLGMNTSISYTTTAQKLNYIADASPTYPLALLNGSIPVVKQVTVPNGISSDVVQKYSYANGILNLQRGFLGFGKFQMTRNIASPTIEKDLSIEQNFEFDLNSGDTHYYQPFLVSSKTKVGSTLIAESDIPSKSYSVTPLLNGQRHVFIYPSVSNQIDHLKNTLTTTTITYDNDGNILTNQVNTSDYDPTVSPVLVASQKTTYNGYQQRISGNLNTYKNAPDNVIVEQTHKDAAGTFSTTTAFVYYTNGTLKQKTDFSGTPKALISSYTYDEVGNLLTTTAGDRKSTLEYNSDKRFVKKQINALNHFTETEYDIWGNPLIKWDINRNPTRYEYDKWGILTSVFSPDGRKVVSSTEWYNKGNASIQLNGVLYYTSSVDEDNQLIGAEYFDAAGHYLRKADAGFNGKIFYTNYDYNKSGQLLRISDPYLSGLTATKFTYYYYDDYGRVKEQSLPYPVKIFTSYDKRKITTTYCPGGDYTKEYDAAGLLVKSTDPGGSITYKYYKNSKPSEIQPSGVGKATSIIYDDYTGAQQELKDPDAGTTKYNYNLYGELLSQTDAESNNTVIKYDELGRIFTKTIGSDVLEYKYDDAGALGLLSYIKKNGVPVKLFKYDGMGRVLEETSTNGTASFTYKYKYDSRSRLYQMTYPNNLVLTYGYTKDDLKSISKDGFAIWTLNPNDVNEFGQIKQVTLGNGKSTVYGYDDQKRLNSISVENMLNFGYTFNDEQQLTLREEKMSDGSVLKGLRDDFVYDPVNRLQYVYDKSKDPAVLKLEMKYEVDRIHSKSDAGTFNYESTENHKPDQINELKALFPQHSITYTNEGKIKTVSETNDAEGNKLLTIDYGIDGQRFKAEYLQSGVRKYTRYYFDTYEKEVLADGSERHLNYIYAGNDLIAICEQKPGIEKMHYIYTDYLGSLRCITDASGNIEQRLSYDAWGNRRKCDNDSKLSDSELALAISLTSRGFTGHEHLDGLGLINMNGRVYDPVLGIFLSPDNYVQTPDFTQNFNRYSYCYNNPLMYTDPSGDFAWLPILAMAYFGGVQANFFTADNPFNPADWNWSSGQTYTGILTGAISGAGMFGFNVLPTIPGAIPNGALQAGINVGINGIGNVIAGDPFFQGAAIPAAMGLASGAKSGYNLAKKMNLNPWTGGMTKDQRAIWADFQSGKISAKKAAELLLPDDYNSAGSPEIESKNLYKKIYDPNGELVGEAQINGTTQPLDRDCNPISLLDAAKIPGGTYSKINIHNGLSGKRFIKTSYHELIHAEQLFSGELYNVYMREYSTYPNYKQLTGLILYSEHMAYGMTAYRYGGFERYRTIKGYWRLWYADDYSWINSINR